MFIYEHKSLQKIDRKLIESLQKVYKQCNKTHLSSDYYTSQQIAYPMASRAKKHRLVNLQKLLLNPVPPEPKPETFYTIEEPDTFNFPIYCTFLENVKIIQQYDPSDINQFVREGIPTEILKYKDKICQLKKKGFVIGKNKLSLEGVSAFHYNETYLVAALQNKALAVYGSDLRLIKEISNFSQKIIRNLFIVSTPTKFQGLIILTSFGHDLTVRRIEKSFFSTLSCKYAKDIMRSRQPYVKFIELPKTLKKKYFSQDRAYSESSIVACLSCSQITLLRVNFNKLNSQGFVDILYNKAHPTKYNICSVSWGQAMINSKDSDMQGVNMILSYSFGDELYLLTPIKNSVQVDNEVQAKFEWQQSFPFKYEKDIVFCQYIKENQFLLIAEDGKIVIFYTACLQFFQRSIISADLDLITYDSKDRFHAKYISTGTQTQIKSYNGSFAYQFGSNQIYYLTQDKIGIFVYCSWTEICQLLIQANNYESAMNFLIALFNKANRFDLGFKHTPENFRQLSSKIQQIASNYVHLRFGKYSTWSEEEFFSKLSMNSTIDQIITPIQFLTTTRQYTYLFEDLKPIMEQYIPESVFFKALEPFIAYGRIKYIPEQMLKYTLDYYVSKQQLDVVERLSIHFDLKEIQKGIVIKCCLDNILVVSLAYICTQGNQSEFVTPFVKFWGIAEDYRRNKQIQYAQYYAMRALWYVKLCLQRSMALRAYSYQKYGYMISILTSNFFTESMITGLLIIRTQTTLQSLSHYFSIENASIVNQFCKLKISPSIPKLPWIDSKQHRQRLEMMLSAIHAYVQIVKSKRQNEEDRKEDQQLFYLFLSKVILFKTIKFIKQKYIEILQFLIQNYECIKLINYGVDRQEGMEEISEEQNQIKASEYITKILTLSIQEANLKNPDLNNIFYFSKLHGLTQLQAQIQYISGQYRKAIEIYLGGTAMAKQNVFSFLENSFKILKLQNKKKQKKSLEAEIQKKITVLIALNPQKTTRLVKTHMPQSQDKLVQELSSQQSLQLQYLEELISTKSSLSEKSIIIYIKLMAKLKSNKLLKILENNENFPVEESIQICQTQKLYDCLQYLYRRMGNIQRSVQMTVLRIEKLLVQQTDYQNTYVQIADILKEVVNFCIQNRSEDVWEKLFDSTIALYQKYKINNKYQGEMDLFYQINGRILKELLSHCSLDHCIVLIREKYGNLDLGGSMNGAFIEVLLNYGFNESIMFLASKLNSNTLADLNFKKFKNNLKGFYIDQQCEVCQQPIDKSHNCVSFYCGHSYHKECAVSLKEERVENRYCIKCLTGQQNQFQLHIAEHGSHRIRIQRMFQDVLVLRQHSLEQFQNNRENYQQQRQVRKHDNAIFSKKQRMNLYDKEKGLLDQTSNKVREDLQRSKRRKNRGA